MTSMLFYEKAVALNREAHQKYTLTVQPDHFAFAKKTNSALLTAGEFAQAALDYPGVFVGQAGGPFTAVALLGLASDENLMVTAAGTWEPDTYIPAFVRRYPFVLAGEERQEALTVCLDEAYAGWNTEQGTRLFEADGSDSTYLKNMVGFLQQFHNEMNQTNALAARLAALGLLASKVITVEVDGQKATLDGLWVVDEQKLVALDDAHMLELARTGALGLIYTHLLSLKSVGRLVRLQTARRKAAAKALAEQLPEGGASVVH